MLLVVNAQTWSVFVISVMVGFWICCFQLFVFLMGVLFFVLFWFMFGVSTLIVMDFCDTGFVGVILKVYVPNTKLRILIIGR